MKISLIICTYMRSASLTRLMESIQLQTRTPDEVLIIDGSTDDATETLFENPESSLQNPQAYKLRYFKVPPEHRGLTRQRNFGINKLTADTDIVAFLDDDTVLDSCYFQSLEKAFEQLPDAAGIGGVAVNENRWKPLDHAYDEANDYRLEGQYVRFSSRNRIRKKLGLLSDQLPGVLPGYSNGLTCSYPLTDKSYPVDLIIGMSMAFRKEVTDQIKFSEYFHGYGLYEDADYSLRALEFGQNYIATAVQLEHHHHPSGRPNQYKYGKMVVRNGWYVWRIKNPNPNIKDRLKWHQISLLLMLIRFLNVFTTPQKKEALTESLGRLTAWVRLFWDRPTLDPKN